VLAGAGRSGVGSTKVGARCILGQWTPVSKQLQRGAVAGQQRADAPTRSSMP